MEYFGRSLQGGAHTARALVGRESGAVKPPAGEPSDLCITALGRLRNAGFENTNFVKSWPHIKHIRLIWAIRGRLSNLLL